MIQVLPDDNEYLRKIFKAYTHGYDNFTGLTNALGWYQKECPEGYTDWKDFVIDVMEGMELHDSGQFPESWFPEENDQ